MIHDQDTGLAVLNAICLRKGKDILWAKGKTGLRDLWSKWTKIHLHLTGPIRDVLKLHAVCL
jgi:hypothetical protein